MSTDTTPLTAAELDDLVRRTRAPGGLVHGFEIRRLVAMARRVERLEEAVRKWDADLSEYCDGPLRDTVRAALSPTTEATHAATD